MPIRKLNDIARLLLVLHFKVSIPNNIMKFEMHKFAYLLSDTSTSSIVSRPLNSILSDHRRCGVLEVVKNHYLLQAFVSPSAKRKTDQKKQDKLMHTSKRSKIESLQERKSSGKKTRYFEE